MMNLNAIHLLAASFFDLPPSISKSRQAIRLCFGLSSLLLLVSVGSPLQALSQEPANSIAQKAQTILQQRCFSCHGEGGANEGGFNYALNHRRLLKNLIVAGQPEASRLYKRCVNQEMPPEGEPLNASELKILQSWIAAGAPSFRNTQAKPKIDASTQAKWIEDDIVSIPPTDRPFARYFTLTHLHNSEYEAFELDTYRIGLTKLLNSLSWGRTIKVPVAIDADRTILRIDTRWYKWNENNAWDAIVANYPFPYDQISETRTRYETLAGHRQPVVRADWFVNEASRPPLYHAILSIPENVRDLENRLGVNVEQNLRDVTGVQRAGFYPSGVSKSNRLIERHESVFGAYWKSYDFLPSDGVQRRDLMAHPLGPTPCGQIAEKNRLFEHDGGEMIFGLPNGLHGFMLTDAKGRRIDRGPTEVVVDKESVRRGRNPEVVNGISCMRCHWSGILDKTDQVRSKASTTGSGFTENERAAILALYPAESEFAKLRAGDRDRYRRAVEACGGTLTTTEPVAALAFRYDDPLDMESAAAESELDVDDFAIVVRGNSELSRSLGGLFLGQSISREVFNARFKLVQKVAYPTTVNGFNQLALGASLQNKTDKMLAYANQALALEPESFSALNFTAIYHYRSGDYVKAARFFTEAIHRKKEDPLLYSNRGDAYRKQEDYVAALADYDQALKLSPKLELALSGKIDTLFAQAKWTETIDLCRLALSDYPNRFSFHKRLIESLDKAGKLPEAVDACNKAMKATSAELALLSLRATLFRKLRDWDRVFADLDRCLELEPSNATIRTHYFASYVDLGRLDDAERVANELMQLDPNNLDHIHRRCNARSRKGNYLSAMEDANTILEKDPKHARALQEKLLIESELRRLDDLAQTAQRMLQSPDANQQASAWSAIAFSHIMQMRMEEALEDISRSLKLVPNLIAPNVNQSYVHLKLGRLEEALRFCQEVPSEIRNDPNVIRQQALALMCLGRHEEALSSLDNYKSDGPISADYFAIHGEVLRSMGRYREAADDFKHVQGSSRYRAVSLAIVFLATCPEAEFRDPQRALELARELQTRLHLQAPNLQAIAIALAANNQWDEAMQVQNSVVNLLDSWTSCPVSTKERAIRIRASFSKHQIPDEVRVSIEQP